MYRYRDAEVVCVLVTVRCPADGVVGVSLGDLLKVVVRSGSDVAATYACPLCGSPITLESTVEPGLADLLAFRNGCAGRADRLWSRDGCGTSPSPPRHSGGSHIEAYAEYFRRELAHADTAEAMIAEMDAPCR